LQDVHFRLPAWNPATARGEALAPNSTTGAEPLQNVSDPLFVTTSDSAKARLLSAPRRLAYRFMALPYHRRVEVAQQLGLLQDEDQGLRDADLFRRFFRRAAERGQLAALWREVESHHHEGKSDDNPFVSA
jgi:GTPase-associated adaptor domain